MNWEMAHCPNAVGLALLSQTALRALVKNLTLEIAGWKSLFDHQEKPSNY